jgi:hypothetical protein
MKKHEAEKLIETIRSFVDEPSGRATASDKGTPEKHPARAIIEDTRAAEAADAGDADLISNGRINFEKLYQKFKARFIDEARIDPILLNLIMVQPEMIVDVERRVQTLDNSTLRGRLARLMAQKYFAQKRAVGTVRRELARTGPDPGGGGTLGTTLNDYVRDGFLVREDDGYIMAPGVKVTERELQTT